MNIRSLSFLVSAATLPGVTALAGETPLNFAEAVFTEVVNDVQVVSAADAKQQPAKKDAKFQAPDLVKTGRKSRAQLTAADGTVARIGSNAVFSFDRDSRSMNLKSGSVLFHSPTGKGGGTIVTNSATASVIGTTIIVSATADGGFKMLVLEGIAKVAFPNGQTLEVKAGQMTFVRPGDLVKTPAGNGGKKDGDKGTGGQTPAGQPGPVVNFDLAAVTAEGGLVAGFKQELPSLGKIRMATHEQGVLIGDGDLRRTGLFVAGATDEQNFQVIPIQEVIAAIQQFDAVRLLDAAQKDLVLDDALPTPEHFIFRIPTPVSDQLLFGGDRMLRGLAAGNLSFAGSAFDLGFLAPSGQHADVVGFKTLTIPGGAFDFNAAGLSSVRIAGGELIIPAGTSIGVLNLAPATDPAKPTMVEYVTFVGRGYDDLENPVGPEYTNVSLSNTTGSLRFVALQRDLVVSGGSYQASGHTLASVELVAPQGAVLVSGSLVSAADLARISGLTQVAIDGGANVSGTNVAVESSGSVSVSGSTLSAYGTRGSLANYQPMYATVTTTPSAVVIRGATVALTDASVSAADRIEVRATVSDASIAGGWFNAGSIWADAVGTLTLGGSGSAASLSATMGGIDLNAKASIQIGDTAVTAYSGTIRVSGTAITTLAGSSFTGQRVEFDTLRAATPGAVSLGATTVNATGVSVDPAPVPPVSGVLIQGTGVTLGEGATVLSSDRVILDARAGNFAATKPDIKADAGIAIWGDAVAFTGVGGSGSPGAALVLGGWIYADNNPDGTGHLALTARQGGVTLQDQVEAKGATLSVDATGTVRIAKARLESTTGVLNVNGGALIITEGELTSAGVLSVGLTGDVLTANETARGTVELTTAKLGAQGDIIIAGGALAATPVTGGTRGINLTNADLIISSGPIVTAGVTTLPPAPVPTLWIRTDDDVVWTGGGASVPRLVIEGLGWADQSAGIRRAARAANLSGVNLTADDIGVSAGAVSLVDSTVSSTGTVGLRATVTNATISGGSLNAGSVFVKAAGTLTLGAGVSTSTASVSAATDGIDFNADSGIQIGDTTVTATTGAIRVSGATITTTAGTSFTGQRVAFDTLGAATPGALTLGATSVQATGVGPNTTLPPNLSGVLLQGSSVTLGEGATVFSADQIIVDARAGNLVAMKPALDADSGIAIWGDSVSLIGTGGSGSPGVDLVLGGWIYADKNVDGTGHLAVTARQGGITLQDYVEATGATVSVDAPGTIALATARLEATTGSLNVNGGALTVAVGDLRSADALHVHVSGVLALTDAAAQAASGMTLTGSRIELTNSELNIFGGQTVMVGDTALPPVQLPAIQLRTDGDVVWSGGNGTAPRLFIEGRSWIDQSANLPGPAASVSLSDLNLSIPEIAVRAGTIELTNVSLAFGTRATLRSSTGLAQASELAEVYGVKSGWVNVSNVTIDGQNIATTDGLVWVPALNVGDVESPVHVLDLVQADYRGTKLDYVRTRVLSGADLTDANGIPNSHIFRPDAPAMLTNADFGVPDTQTLPTLSLPGESQHSILEVKGVLAQAIGVGAGDFAVNLADIDARLDGQGMYADRIGIVSLNGLNLGVGGVLRFTGMSNVRQLEVIARDIHLAAGAGLVQQMAYDAAFPRENSKLQIGAINGVTLDSGSVIKNTAGSIDIGAVNGDVLLTDATIMAGAHDPAQTQPGMLDQSDPQSGSVILSTMSPTAKIRVVGGDLVGHVSQFDSASRFGIEVDGATLDISGATIRSVRRVASGSEANYTSNVGQGMTTGVDVRQVGDEVASGIIRLHGALMVKMQGGKLIASDVQMMVPPAATDDSADFTRDAIDLDGVQFAMTASQYVADGRMSTGISMEAKSVFLQNIVFPDSVQVRLKSKDGILNIGSRMFGAVNFVSNVGVRTAGSTDQVTVLAGPGGGANVAGINSKVWVEGGAAKIYVNGTAQPVTPVITGTSTAGAAPIHIQTQGATNQQGLHGNNF